MDENRFSEARLMANKWLRPTAAEKRGVAPPRPETGCAPTPADGGPSSGMVLRFCGIEKKFFYADSADKFCLCGHQIGAV